jgi:hypothetical protein
LQKSKRIFSQKVTIFKKYSNLKLNARPSCGMFLLV